MGTYRTALCILPPEEIPDVSACRTARDAEKPTSGDPAYAAAEAAEKWSAEHFFYAAANASKKWFAEHYTEYMQIIKGHRLCCFLFERHFSREFFLQLHQELTDYLPGKVYFGIHESVMGNTEAVNRAIVLAEQILVIRYYDEEQKLCYFPEKIALKEHSPKGTRLLLDSLKEAVETFSGKESEAVIRQILSTIRTDPYIHINVLRRIFMDMLGIYSMTAQKLNGAIEEIRVRGDNCHYQRLMMMGSLNLIEGWFLEFQDIFYRQFFVAYKCSRSDLLKSIFSYIDSHLTTQVHLSEAAKETGVSNAYLSTVFKKEMGVNFIEYVNQRKVELAKQMLEEGKLVYEVSDVLGFENCTYFSKVFKKYEGISPDGYKRKEKGAVAFAFCLFYFWRSAYRNFSLSIKHFSLLFYILEITVQSKKISVIKTTQPVILTALFFCRSFYSVFFPFPDSIRFDILLLYRIPMQKNIFIPYENIFRFHLLHKLFHIGSPHRRSFFL